MRRTISSLVVTLLCLVSAGTADAASVAGLVGETNAERAAAGLPPLSMNQALSTAAASKAADMIRNDYWSHVSPSGVGPWYWISSAGYPYLYAGENLAQGSGDDGVVISAWMASPEHRANLLSQNFRDMGCGFASGVLLSNQTIVVACDFGSTSAEMASPVAAAPAKTQPAEITANSPTVLVATAPQPTAAPATAGQPQVPAPDYFERSVLYQPPRPLGDLLHRLLVQS